MEQVCVLRYARHPGKWLMYDKHMPTQSNMRLEAEAEGEVGEGL